MFGITCRVDSENSLSLYQADREDMVRVFKVNNKGDFCGIAEFTQLEFGEIIRKAVENKGVRKK